jgi:protein-S-isoprenylcysteine O-methyltransferase Ste14
MNDILRIVLFAYFIAYFGVAIVLKSFIVAKRIGKSPLVLPKDDSTYGTVGFYFKLTLFVLFLYILALTFSPILYNYFLPINSLELISLKYIGFSLLILSFVWTVIAQIHMKNSWRIGIDTETETELITNGVFKLSRNPIFFGMIVTLAGLFLTTPNALTLLFFILSYVLIQIEIRLEEEFLTKQYGQRYSNYKQKVRRFI